MASLLQYRYPGGSIVRKSGHFVPFAGQDGFLVSDFTGEHKYVFEEGEELHGFHFRSIPPLVIGKEDYLVQAQNFIEAIKQEQLGKAVFSRIKQVQFSDKSVEALFDALEQKYPNTFVYLISDPHFGTWIGASPEILLIKEGERTKTMSLAGTLAVNSNLRWTSKEELEQKLVTEFITDCLKQQQVKSLEVSDRYERMAGPIKHLCNDITFESSPEDFLKIAFDLHPTPAVSGLPRTAALQLINRTEKHQRFLYTGIIGEQQKLYVNLRCCEIQMDFAYLYLGGGFTAQSCAESEWLETENKSLTLINVMQALT